MNPIDFSARRPVVTLAIAALFTLIAVLCILRLRPESALDALLDPNDASTAAMGKIMADFPVASELLVLVSTPSGAADDPARLIDFAARFSAAAEGETHLIRRARYQPDPSARAFIEHVMVPAGLLYLDDAQASAARARLTPGGMAAALTKDESMLAIPGPAAGGLAKALVQDPLRLHELLLPRFEALAQLGGSFDAGAGSAAFFSPTARDLLIRIEGTRPPGDLAFSKALTDRAAAMVAQLNTGHLDVHISGAYAITAHNAAAIRWDAIIGSMTSVITLAAWFILLYRRPVRLFLMAFIPIALGLIWGFGAYALIRSTITPLAAVVGGALGGIGIDYSIYKLAHHRAGQSPAVTIRRLFAPSLAALATSVIGFAVIAFSPLRILRDFSLVGTLGLGGAWVGTVLLLPAMLALFGKRWPAESPMRLPLAEWLWKLISPRPIGILYSSAAVLIVIAIIAMIFGRPILQDADLHLLHPQPNPPLAALDEIDRRMGVSADGLMVYVSGDSEDQIVSRCYEVDRLLPPDSLIRGTLGPATLLPDPAVAARRRNEFTPADADRAARDFRSAVAASNFGADQFAGYGDFLETLLTPTRVPSLVDLRQYSEWANLLLPRASGRKALTLVFLQNPSLGPPQMSAAIDTLRNRLAAVDGVSLTGMSAVSIDTQSAASETLPRTIVLAGLLIALYLAAHFRSFIGGAAAVVPSAVSLFLLLVVMRLFGLQLNLVNLVMVPLLMGMNVDYGIFAADVLRRRHEPAALRQRFVAGTAALLGCCGTAMLGFASLATTSIPAVRSLGVLVTVGVGACMLATLFVLWPIVIWLQRRRAV